MVLGPSYESWKYAANYVIFFPTECFDENRYLAVTYTESN